LLSFMIISLVLINFVQFYFFFSSRIRHTISKRDWSSDVCSSDLEIPAHRMECPYLQGARRLLFPGLPFNPLPHLRSRLIRKRDRSEERRVGKEFTSQLAP